MCMDFKGKHLKLMQIASDVVVAAAAVVVVGVVVVVMVVVVVTVCESNVISM